MSHPDTPFRYASYRPDGRVCCAGNRPDFPRCEHCRVTATTTATTTAPAPVALAAPKVYQAAESAAPYAPAPTDDPLYRPHGTAPDSYYLALAARQLHAERKEKS